MEPPGGAETGLDERGDVGSAGDVWPDPEPEPEPKAATVATVEPVVGVLGLAPPTVLLLYPGCGTGISDDRLERSSREDTGAILHKNTRTGH